MIDFIQSHLRKRIEEIDRFSHEANQVFETVESQADSETTATKESEIHVAVARMEVCMERLLDSYDDVRCVQPSRQFLCTLLRRG